MQIGDDIIKILDQFIYIANAVMMCFKKRSGYMIETLSEYYRIFDDEATKFVKKNYEVKCDDPKILNKSVEEFVLKTYGVILGECFKNEQIIRETSSKISSKCYVEATSLCLHAGRINLCPVCELKIEKHMDNEERMQVRVNYNMAHIDVYNHVVSKKKAILKFFINSIKEDIGMRALEFERTLKYEARRKQKQ